jgi:predicted DNA-binding protein YlxM (UPF0122 family)
MFFYLKWYIKRRTSAEGFLPERRAEVNKLIAEIDRITDRDSQLVEERIKKLREILDEADKRVSVYAKELEKSRTGEALYTSLGRGIRAALKTPEDSSAQAQTLVKEEPPKLSTVRPDIAVVKPAPPSQPELALVSETQSADLAKTAPSRPPSKRQIRYFIDLLANEGLSAQEIAQRLEISLAEVNLAMNLRRTKG